jgi:hypothetical protein
LEIFCNHSVFRLHFLCKAGASSPANILEVMMKNVSDRGESKGFMAIAMVVGLVFGLIFVFDHIAGLQNHWAGSF